MTGGSVAAAVWLTVGAAAVTGLGWVAAAVAGAALAVAVRVFLDRRRVAGRCRPGPLWPR